MMPRLFRSSTFFGLLAASVLLAACRPADDAAKQGGAETGDARSAAEAPVPKIVSKDGRHALMVDGAPFLILGAQVNNSSNWPQALDDVGIGLAITLGIIGLAAWAARRYAPQLMAKLQADRGARGADVLE